MSIPLKFVFWLDIRPTSTDSIFLPFDCNGRELQTDVGGTCYAPIKKEEENDIRCVPTGWSTSTFLKCCAELLVSNISQRTNHFAQIPPELACPFSRLVPTGLLLLECHQVTSVFQLSPKHTGRAERTKRNGYSRRRPRRIEAFSATSAYNASMSIGERKFIHW